MGIFEKILTPEKTPKILYHYTSQKGLLGIVDSRAIWATNIRFLKNNSDQSYAIDMVQKELEHKLNELGELQENPGDSNNIPNISNSNPKNSNPNNKIIRLLNKIRDKLNSTERFHIFVCSFSQDGDQVGQWRNPNLNGNGFSLGFRASKLSALIAGQEFTLIKCNHDASHQVKIVKGLINEAIQKIDNLHEESSEWLLTLNNVVDEYAIKFVQLSAIFRHPSFFEGTEWRLFSMPFPILPTDSSILFREGDSMLIPFLKFALTNKPEDEMPFERIIIGPTPYKELSGNSVELFLSARNLKSCQVDFSNIPYGIG